MGLKDGQRHQVSDRIGGDTGDRKSQNTSGNSSSLQATTSEKQFEASRGASSSSSSHEDEGYTEDQERRSTLIPSECRTFLLTQAANLAGPSAAARGASHDGTVNEVTPPTAALETPSSPPIACATSPSSSSLGSPSSSMPMGSNSPTSKTARKRGVPHIYRDFTNIPDTAGYVRKKTGGVTQPFPEKLHEMLDQVNEPSLVAWLPHGRAFIVRKPKEFTAQIMPKYFRQTKLTSFQRQ